MFRLFDCVERHRRPSFLQRINVNERWSRVSAAFASSEVTSHFARLARREDLESTVGE